MSYVTRQIKLVFEYENESRFSNDSRNNFNAHSVGMVLFYQLR